MPDNLSPEQLKQLVALAERAPALLSLATKLDAAERSGRFLLWAINFLSAIAGIIGFFALVRAGGAVACTICQGPDDGAGSPVPVKGFQGVRYRWWDRAVEGPFHEWQTWGLTPRDRAHVERLIRLRRVPELRAKLQSKALAHVLDQDSRWDRFLREFPS